MKWLYDLRLSRKLLVVYLFFFGLMLLLGFYALGQLAKINGQIRQIQGNWMPSGLAAQSMRADLLDFRVSELQHILSTDEAAHAHYEESLRRQLSRFKSDEETYVRLLSTPEEEAAYREFRKMFDAYLDVSGRMIELSRQNRKREALDMLRDQSFKLKEGISHAVDRLVQINNAGGAQAGSESAATLESAREGSLLLLGLAALAGVLGGAYVGRAFSGAVSLLQRAGVHTSTGAAEMSAAIREQEATVTEQAASTTEIAAAAKEISATARELSNTMDEIARVAEETGRRAAESRQHLARLDRTMAQMVEASNAIVAKLAVLNEKAGNINTVVTTIARVADRANLLSLNAAIEAEKAGEYGQGFSVVAREIRRLADQTSVATHDIEQILKEMQSAVSASVMGMDKFSEEIRRNTDGVRQIGQQLSLANEQIQALNPRFEAVYQGMQAQTLGTDQITEAMSQFSEGMQQTVEAIRSSQQSMGLLSQAVQDVQSVVKQF